VKPSVSLETVFFKILEEAAHKVDSPEHPARVSRSGVPA
jgi:hypothetical protein